MDSPVIADKAQSEQKKRLEEWPRPESVPCSCGKTAWQKEKGMPQYVCVYCSTSTIVWTGFDDPTWF